jgi:4-hydroxymandelate oxidase
VSPADWEAAARQRLEPPAWAYYAGGAGDEVTLADNVAGWRRWALRPRVLVDVSRVDPATTLLGRPRPHPVLVAPMAFQVGAHPSGEIGLARAAGAAGAAYCLSTSASTAPRDLAEAVPDVTRWFQLYIRGGIEGALRTLTEVGELGYEAVLLTVDFPVVGWRDRERTHPWDPDPALTTVAAGGAPLAALDWRDLETLVAGSPVPLLVKGVLDARDARLAVDCGAAGVVVSNHGGRQLDTVLATADVLQEIAAEVAGAVDVLVDGGVRRGTDVVVALALGARAVLVGRPCLWGLAVGGQDGARAVLEQLLAETEAALALLGVPRAADVGADHVARTAWR